METLRSGGSGRIHMPTGTLGPALHRLERAGLIAGSWSMVGGRRRRTYRPIPAGRSHVPGRAHRLTGHPPGARAGVAHVSHAYQMR
jgi:DNA-binding PadR family transcriptional regulator